MNPFDLTGRVAVVTGGNGGIGLGMARGLAGGRGGGRRRRAQPREIRGGGRAHWRRSGATSAFVALDVADPAIVPRRWCAQTVERFGRLDILVNNAGMSIRKPPENYAVAEWQAVLDTNLTGAFVCCQAAYPVMKPQGGGKIINIGSMMSIFGGAYAAPYSSSKGGIVQMTKSLAHRLGQGQHPGQRGVAGLDRHRIDPRRARPGAGAQRARAGPHPGRPLGRARRPRRDRGVSRRPGLGFRDRRRDPGRRRLRRRSSRRGSAAPVACETVGAGAVAAVVLAPHAGDGRRPRSASARSNPRARWRGSG